MSNLFNDLPDKEIEKFFFRNGAEFFAWNSGKNTPNILHMVATNTEKLEATLAKASASSDRLAEALNKLTKAGLIIGFLSLLVAAVAVTLEVIKFMADK